MFDKQGHRQRFPHTTLYSLRFSTGKAISWIQFIANPLLLFQNHNSKSRSLRTELIVIVSPLTQCLTLLSGLHVSVSVSLIIIVLSVGPSQSVSQSVSCQLIFHWKFFCVGQSVHPSTHTSLNLPSQVHWVSALTCCESVSQYSDRQRLLRW